MFFAISCTTKTTVIAQNGAGSVYSMFGIGELSRTHSSASHAMGYTSIGLSSPYQINVTNPAANDQAGSYFNHVFDVGFYYANTTYESDGKKEQGSYGGLSNFSFWFKYNDRWNGTIGLSNYSNVGYNIYKQNVNSFQDGDYDIAYQGTGGLNEFFFSNGFSVSDNFSVGLKLMFIFGNISHTEDVTGGQSLKRYYTEDVAIFFALDAEYSLNYRIQKEAFNINFGLIYKNPTRLSGANVSTITEQDFSEGVEAAQGVLSYELDRTTKYTIPRRVGFGISYNSEKVVLASDVEFNQWSQGEIEGYTDDLQDSWRYSFGVQLTPDRTGNSALGRWDYRMGGFYENSYLKIENTSFGNYGVTFGLGIPIRSGSMINLAYQRGVNGTVESGLIYESTHELSINLCIRQRWFQRYKYQ